MKKPFVPFLSLLLVFLSAGLAPALAQEKTHTNSLGMGFVHIPAGSFLMGSPESEKYHYYMVNVLFVEIFFYFFTFCSK